MAQSVAEKQGSPFFRCVDVLGERTPPAAEDFDEENSRIAEAALRILFKTAPGLTVDEVKKAGRRYRRRFSFTRTRGQKLRTQSAALCRNAIDETLVGYTDLPPNRCLPCLPLRQSDQIALLE